MRGQARAAWHTLVAATALAAGLCAGPVQAREPVAQLDEIGRQQLEQGLKAARQHKWQPAIEAFERARRQALLAPAPLWNRALVLDSLGGAELVAASWYRAYLWAAGEGADGAPVKARIAKLEARVELRLRALLDRLVRSRSALQGLDRFADAEAVDRIEAETYAYLGDVETVIKRTSGGHLQAARVFIEAGEFDKARRIADALDYKAPSPDWQRRNDQMRAIILGDLAETRARLGDLEEARSLVGSMKDEFPSNLIVALVQLGDLEIRRHLTEPDAGYLHSARSRLERAIQLARRPEAGKERARLLMMCANLAARLQIVDPALLPGLWRGLANEAIELSRALDPARRADVQIQLARGSRYLGRDPKGLLTSTLREAEAIADKVTNPRRRAGLLADVAFNWAKADNTAEVLRLVGKMDRLSTSTGVRWIHWQAQRARQLAARALVRQGRADEAWKMAEGMFEPQWRAWTREAVAGELGWTAAANVFLAVATADLMTGWDYLGNFDAFTRRIASETPEKKAEELRTAVSDLGYFLDTLRRNDLMTAENTPPVVSYPLPGGSRTTAAPKSMLLRARPTPGSQVAALIPRGREIEITARVLGFGLWQEIAFLGPKQSIALPGKAKVLKLIAKAGDHVRVGDVLARIDRGVGAETIRAPASGRIVEVGRDLENRRVRGGESLFVFRERRTGYSQQAPNKVQ